MWRWGLKFKTCITFGIKAGLIGIVATQFYSSWKAAPRHVPAAMSAIAQSAGGPAVHDLNYSPEFLSLNRNKIESKEEKEQLMELNIQYWLGRVENPQLSLEDRIEASKVLASVGDPRIRIFDPLMVTIPGSSRVSIGLLSSELKKTFDRLKNTGVALDWIAKEIPKHTVEIKAFKLAKYLITNSEYWTFVKETQEKEIPTSWPNGSPNEEKLNHPVYTVSAEAAERYIDWMNQKTDRNFRLVTEYEWEYAAAGPNGNEYPWGNEYDAEKSNTRETQLNDTVAIGVFVTGNSQFGINDVAGNIEEFVSGRYFPYPGGKSVADSFGHEEKKYQMTRGGAFNKMHDLIRCKRRHGYYPGHAIGFRLAETIVQNFEENKPESESQSSSENANVSS